MAIQEAGVSRKLHLAHGWELQFPEGTSVPLVREYIRPVVRAVPSLMARQIGFCRISLAIFLGSNVVSSWSLGEREVEISIASGDRDAHDVAMELLICLGQALWEKLISEQLRAYWLLLDSEFLAGVKGEIDEDALKEKQALLGGHLSATSDRRLKRYGRASFAGTAAEYVHCLWHDVEVVRGPEHLPAQQLRRRLELLRSWFPPDRGHNLYPLRRRGSAV